MDDWSGDWLDELENLSPEEIERRYVQQHDPKMNAAVAPPRPKRRLVLPRNPFAQVGEWYEGLDFWDKREFQSFLLLCSLLAAVPATFAFVHISVYGMPGQYRGAYQLAK